MINHNITMHIIREHFESINSTNDWAKQRLKSLSTLSLLLVTAEHQSAGRGQYGRRWISPKGKNIYASFAFFVQEAQDPLLLTRSLSLAIQDTLQQAGVHTTFKRPNDLLVNQKKIAGILCETVDTTGIVIGLGLNVNMSQEELASIDQPATSLLVETGHEQNLADLLERITVRFNP